MQVSTSHSVLLVACALFGSALLTRVMLTVTRRMGWIVHPRSDRWNARSVSQFGGVPVLLAFAIGAASLPLGPQLKAIAGLTIMVGLVGLWDDLHPLPPRVKLLAQLAIAGVAVSAGLVYPLSSVAWWNQAFTVVWIVGITNALNLLDNMDGLAGGVAVISALTLASLTQDTATLYMLLLMAACISGFLVFNFNPARIFMGDTGSLALGFFLACCSVLATQHVSTIFSLLFIPTLALFLPIFDTLLVSVTRRLNARAISAGAKDHTSHRLVRIGLSERKAVLILYAISAASGLVAILWKRVWPTAGPGMLGLFLITTALFWLYMAKVELPESWLSRSNVFTLAIPTFVHSLATRAGLIFFDCLLIILAQYLALLLRFDHVSGSLVPIFFASACLAVALKLPLFALFGVYRRSWTRDVRQGMYAVAKGTTVASLLMIAILTYANRFDGFSRAVFVMDIAVTMVLILGARLSGRIFEDALRPAGNGRTLLIGGSSTEFFARYFEWKELGSRSLLLVRDDQPDGGPLSEIPALLREEGRSVTLFLAPDCQPSTEEYVTALARFYGVPCSKFNLHLHDVVAAGAGPSHYPQTTATLPQ